MDPMWNLFQALEVRRRRGGRAAAKLVRLRGPYSPAAGVKLATAWDYGRSASFPLDHQGVVE